MLDGLRSRGREYAAECNISSEQFGKIQNMLANLSEVAIIEEMKLLGVKELVVKCTVSIGVVCSSGHIQDIWRYVDSSCCDAKSIGRNQIAMITLGEESVTARRATLRIFTSLQQALVDSERFELLCQ